MDALSDAYPACWVQSQRGAVPNMLSSTIRTNAMTCLILSIFSSPLFVCADLTILRFISLSNRLSDICCTSVCTPRQRLKKATNLQIDRFLCTFCIDSYAPPIVIRSSAQPQPAPRQALQKSLRPPVCPRCFHSESEWRQPASWH